jgi:drug/metabolite transporter (DMT)-like permease
MTLTPAIAVWEWPSAESWGWVIAAGFFGTAVHMTWTRALMLGEASELTPISFTQLPAVALLGWLLFGESVDGWSLLGAAIILGSNVYIARREALLRTRVNR